MLQIVWQTPAGSLGTVPEGIFYSIPISATSTDTVYYQLIAGALPKGMQINETGILSGIPNSKAKVQGVPSDVKFDTTSKFAVRAYTKTGSIVTGFADKTFTIEVTNATIPTFDTPPGQIAELYDASLVTGIQIQYSGPSNTVIRLVSGELPPGLTINSIGLISGLIGITSATTNYQFTLEATDGSVNGSTLRTFSIYLYSRSTLTADDTYITADNTFITADGTPILVPILLNPEGSIGTIRSDNFFAYQFEGVDLTGGAVQYLINTDIPGLTLDINSGWLYGNIPPLGINQKTYNFDVYVRLKDQVDVLSEPYAYSLTIIGPVNADITWITPSYLGSIDNGATSIFYVKAVNSSGLALQYQLLSGSDSRLPQGLQLLATGEIAGRVSFDTFALDLGTTTFDNNTTTFDLVCTFTVNASSVNGLVNDNKTFSIRVNRAYNEPYDNLYIQAMPPTNDRVIINSLLQNTDIFKQNLLYRPTDPNFGVAKNVKYYHAYGLTAATWDEYVASLDINHYWKNLVLGQIEVAQAKDIDGNVVYEVVYSRIVDNLVNNQGQSVSKDIQLPYTVSTGPATGVSTVYPNSLVNMRDQVIDVVGQISNTLPLWMTSKQANGSVLGFTPAWVIAYANPGCGDQLSYLIGQNFIEQLNIIDFEVDRYEVDNLLTKNWNRDEQHWGYAGDPVTPHPATLTTFDMSHRLATWINNSDVITTWEDDYYTLATWTYGTPPGTIFDGGSLQFVAPVDMYSNTNSYDKYLLFPRRNILSPLPQAGTLDWVNNAEEPLTWTNESDQTFVWVGGNE